MRQGGEPQGVQVVRQGKSTPYHCNFNRLYTVLEPVSVLLGRLPAGCECRIQGNRFFLYKNKFNLLNTLSFYGQHICLLCYPHKEIQSAKSARTEIRARLNGPKAACTLFGR